MYVRASQPLYPSPYRIHFPPDYGDLLERAIGTQSPPVPPTRQRKWRLPLRQRIFGKHCNRGWLPRLPHDVRHRGNNPRVLGAVHMGFHPQTKTSNRNYVVIKKVIRACLCYVGRNAATVLDAYAAVFVGQTLLKRLSSFRACLCDVGCNATAVMDAYVSVLSVRLV